MSSVNTIYISQHTGCGLNDVSQFSHVLIAAAADDLCSKQATHLCRNDRGVWNLHQKYHIPKSMSGLGGEITKMKMAHWQ